jgi:hypothetical protein
MELDEHIPGSRPNQLPTMPASPMSPASGPHFIDNNFGCDPPARSRPLLASIWVRLTR